MDALHSHSFMKTSLIFLLLYLFQPSTGQICSAPLYVEVPENNRVGSPVAEITVQNEVTLELNPAPDNPFTLQENWLLAAKKFDYEDKRSYEAIITCTSPKMANIRLDIRIQVLITNVNDNPPVFEQEIYHVNVSEMSPVGTKVGNFPATDRDNPPQLFYTLTSNNKLFKLSSATVPDVLINATLNYDKVKNVTLVLQVRDSSDNTTNVASTTIMVTITDIDNRPPWFQPCSDRDIGEAVVCYSDGYTSSVFINEKVTGVLQLNPGPLYAIDGDSGINEEITYSFLSGNEDMFEINANTGNITMLKPTNSTQSIRLTVLAAQKNGNQFATTTVTISVHVKSHYPPQFQKPRYKGVITEVGSMAVMENGEPLFILATDKDYEGINPHIVYSVDGSDHFSIVDGYLFMMKDLPHTTLFLRVVATDQSVMNHPESDTAELVVEVKSVVVPTDSVGSQDMVALGVSLGVLLLVCLVVIGALVHHLRRGKEDWRKINEVNMFRSSLGQGSGGFKEGLQYNNEAFQKAEDEGDPAPAPLKEGGEVDDRKAVDDTSLTETSVTFSLPLQNLLPDDTSQAGSDEADSEKEIKPILTKERRTEDGYKSVWFKEDIDPDAKEEVVIFPDSGEDDSEEEEEEEQEEQEEEEEERDKSRNKNLEVDAEDTDLDSGVGLKIQDPQDDSEDDETLTSNL